MNIILISREYPLGSYTGGIGTYTEKTARALVRLGQTVYVITEGQRASTETIDGVVVMQLAVSRARPREAGLIARGRNVAQAVDRLPQPPDIVQACEFGGEGFWYALRNHPQAKLVTHLATPTFLMRELNKDSYRGGLRARADKARLSFIDQLERVQTRRSDAIVSETNALADIVSHRWRIPRGRIATIAQGVDFADRCAPIAGELPAELREQDYIVYFGRLEERKGVHILGQALPGILAAYPQLHAVFAGYDSLYKGQSMQAYVQSLNTSHTDRLHFYPRLPQEQLYPLLDHALVAVLPSLWENLANAGLEALDMGKPVVATTGCGFGEVIEDGRSGILVPPGDAPALRQAVIALLADRDHVARMSQAAKARADSYSLMKKTEDLLRFFTALHDPVSGRKRTSIVVGGE